jgi:hypothetical protein
MRSQQSPQFVPKHATVNTLTLGDQFSLLQETKDKVEHLVNSSKIFGITENCKVKYSDPNCDSASLKFI